MQLEMDNELEVEVASMQVQLLQNRLSMHPVPINVGNNSATASAKDPEQTLAHGSNSAVVEAPTEGLPSTLTLGPHALEKMHTQLGSDGVVSLDHNGNVCMLCGRPLSERLGNRKYSKFRMDCGGRSSSAGPSAVDLALPAVRFASAVRSRQTPTNGFCELNFAKSCVDAVANKDYLYWPKSLDLASAAMRANSPWDARYCHLNGFLERSIVELQNNFTGMQGKARELCSTKYDKYGIDKLTFLDMMSKSRYDDREAPTLEEAELLAAWNCAMGDLGCDMAMCAYSFCRKDGGSFGLYGECAGWDPVMGMQL